MEKMPDEIYAWMGFQDNGSWDREPCVCDSHESVKYIRADLAGLSPQIVPAAQHWVTVSNDGARHIVVKVDGVEVIRDFYVSGETELHHSYNMTNMIAAAPAPVVDVEGLKREVVSALLKKEVSRIKAQALQGHFSFNKAQGEFEYFVDLIINLLAARGMICNRASSESGAEPPEVNEMVGTEVIAIEYRCFEKFKEALDNPQEPTEELIKLMKGRDRGGKK